MVSRAKTGKTTTLPQSRVLRRRPHWSATYRLDPLVLAVWCTTAATC
jgi:hypothetical protein